MQGIPLHIRIVEFGYNNSTSTTILPLSAPGTTPNFLSIVPEQPTQQMETQELFSVKGMVAVITGGGTGRPASYRTSRCAGIVNLLLGIGFMIAKVLALNGAAKVYIVGRRAEKLHEAAQFHPRYREDRIEHQIGHRY